MDEVGEGSLGWGGVGGMRKREGNRRGKGRRERDEVRKGCAAKHGEGGTKRETELRTSF